MKCISLLQVLFLMIAMQSGIVTANIHSVAPEQLASQSHNDATDLSADDQHNHGSCVDDCSCCAHGHCAHFVALPTSHELAMKHSQYVAASFYLPNAIVGQSSSQFRPPKA